MSYVQRLGYGRGKMDAVGEWDSRWSIDGGLGDWKDDVTSTWGTIWAQMELALQKWEGTEHHTTYRNSITRCQSIHGKVLAGQITPKSFAQTCRGVLDQLQAGPEAYTAVDFMAGRLDDAYAAAVAAAKAAPGVVAANMKAIAKAAGEAFGAGVKGASEGAGTPLYVTLGYVALGLGAFYAVRRVLA